MDGTETEYIDQDRSSPELQGKRSGMTVDEDISQFPCQMWAAYWYSLLINAKPGVENG
jgi:hypothetical protein